MHVEPERRQACHQRVPWQKHQVRRHTEQQQKRDHSRRSDRCEHQNRHRPADPRRNAESHPPTLTPFAHRSRVAPVLGVDDRGVIEPGKLADLIAVAGKPLDDVSTLETVLFVMKGGDVFKRP